MELRMTKRKVTLVQHKEDNFNNPSCLGNKRPLKGGRERVPVTEAIQDMTEDHFQVMLQRELGH